MTEHKPHDAPAKGGRIDSEIETRQIVEIGAWLFGTTIAAFVVGWLIYYGLGHLANRADRAAAGATTPAAVPATVPTPPAPALQAFGRDAAGRPLQPEDILLAFRKSEEEHLSSWGWIDRQAGIARVPIERAIEMLAVPDEPAAETPAAAPAEVASPAAPTAPHPGAS